MNARITILTAATVLGGCAAVAGIGDIELADPAPASPIDGVTTTSSSADDPPLADAAGPIATDAATPPPPDATIGDATIEAASDATVDAPVVVDPVDDPIDEPAGPTKCVWTDFLANDRRADAAARTIAFPVAGSYDPRCMLIRVGQSVTFVGDLAVHPLAPRGTSPAPNPITLTTAGTSVTFTFPVRGRYRYGSPGTPTLRGVIDVRP